MDSMKSEDVKDSKDKDLFEKLVDEIEALLTSVGK